MKRSQSATLLCEMYLSTALHHSTGTLATLWAFFQIHEEKHSVSIPTLKALLSCVAMSSTLVHHGLSATHVEMTDLY